MISKKAKYALKALKVLAEQYGKGPVLISYIAEKEKIPKKFLEAILLDLRNNGVLQSQKGKGGGYLLRVPPGEVNFSKVLRIIDGPIAPALCVSTFMANAMTARMKKHAACAPFSKDGGMLTWQFWTKQR